MTPELKNSPSSTMSITSSLKTVINSSESLPNISSADSLDEPNDIEPFTPPTSDNLSSETNGCNLLLTLLSSLEFMDLQLERFFHWLEKSDTQDQATQTTSPKLS